AASGGFSEFPRGKPEVFTTAVGIMAVKELNLPMEKYQDAIKFLGENAKDFEEMRIAAAALETAGKSSPKTEAWREQMGRMKIPSAAGGETSGAARGAASIIVTHLRLGGEYESTEGFVKLLKDGQRQSGAYGKEGAAADLESTYRVMRAFVMLKSRPKDL